MATKTSVLISGDKRKARVQFEPTGSSPMVLEMDEADLTDAISQLAFVRADMAEKVPASLDRGNRIEAIADYGWNVQAQKTDGRRIVSFRHPGFGWMTFAMPDDDAAELAKWLTKQMPG